MQMHCSMLYSQCVSLYAGRVVRSERASNIAAHQADLRAMLQAEVEARPAPRELHGFELVREQFVSEYDSQVLMYRHKKTGAHSLRLIETSIHSWYLQEHLFMISLDCIIGMKATDQCFYNAGAEVMSLINKDENKTFGAVFRTPVDNSKGIPHILEHSVLCGSKKYPIKEPFVELMKGSLNTFLNAFTYPDRTCYPVASTNLQVQFCCCSKRNQACSVVRYGFMDNLLSMLWNGQDFYNLVDVYLDAVLYPNCVRDEKTFAQEGWHYELENPEVKTFPLHFSVGISNMSHDCSAVSSAGCTYFGGSSSL